MAGRGPAPCGSTGPRASSPPSRRPRSARPPDRDGRGRRRGDLQGFPGPRLLCFVPTRVSRALSRRGGAHDRRRTHRAGPRRPRRPLRSRRRGAAGRDRPPRSPPPWAPRGVRGEGDGGHAGRGPRQYDLDRGHRHVAGAAGREAHGAARRTRRVVRLAGAAADGADR
ncbi:hypothetical protein FRIGORI9N_510011 [Frigoribacterium sp. 9N]|nr:hypothetical protein FRIGORI9N_510011 [Frigoribacterium sp. 9N]